MIWLQIVDLTTGLLDPADWPENKYRARLGSRMFGGGGELNAAVVEASDEADVLVRIGLDDLELDLAEDPANQIALHDLVVLQADTDLI
jgi:hypothetical protein